MRFVYSGNGGHGDRIMATTNDRDNWYAYADADRWVFNREFRVKPGRVEVDHVEWASHYAGRLIVAPTGPTHYCGENKCWPHWQELVDRSPFPLAQCAPIGGAYLNGVDRIATPTFAHAVSVLAVSRGIVTTEGGMHHAAGALGKAAVVIFGAFNLPQMFGYDCHVNIEEPDSAGLGQRETHRACVSAMHRISVDRVIDAMARLWG